MNICKLGASGIFPLCSSSQFSPALNPAPFTDMKVQGLLLWVLALSLGLESEGHGGKRCVVGACSRMHLKEAF